MLISCKRYLKKYTKECESCRDKFRCWTERVDTFSLKDELVGRKRDR